MKIKDLRIEGSKENDIHLTHLDDENKCYIMTSSYMEVTGCALNKTQVKRVIAWLNKWVKLKEEVSE
jgi:hypothetical protein